MIIAELAFKSVMSRKATAILTVLSIALSVFLMLGVEKLRTGFKQSFIQTISGTDLIVGPRTSQSQLLLYSMFHIGTLNNSITMKSLNVLKKSPAVRWVVPISMGDSHRGFRVIGTTADYFENIKNAANNQLVFSKGGPFSTGLEVVIGSKIARKFSYKTGDKIVLGHGLGSANFIKHEREHFVISGVLEATGMPIDTALLVSLESIEAMHEDWVPGQPTDNADQRTTTEPHSDDAHTHEDENVSAAFVKLKSRIAILQFQRQVNEFTPEPLSAVIPAVAFAEIWQLISKAEIALLGIAAMVVVTAIMGLAVTLLSSLNERRREMMILRSLGAKPITIFGLYLFETLLLSTIGVLIGIFALYYGLWALQDKITQLAGLVLTLDPPTSNEILMITLIIAAALIAAIIPALRAYRQSLADGLAIQS